MYIRMNIFRNTKKLKLKAELQLSAIAKRTKSNCRACVFFIIIRLFITSWMKTKIKEGGRKTECDRPCTAMRWKKEKKKQKFCFNGKKLVFSLFFWCVCASFTYADTLTFRL